MDLSWETPGQCPGFIVKPCQGSTPDPLTSWLLPLQVPAAHSQVVRFHHWTAPIQACYSDKEASVYPPRKLPAELGVRQKLWLTFNGAMLKVQVHSTIKSNEFQKTNKNSIKGSRSIKNNLTKCRQTRVPAGSAG